ncbi:bile acid:sodium symporter family protein [Aeromicrobium duanguangcaii]|uniref:Bile acid:sodium symporter family protein n=1 Tax=Aeromicrobium duanguangcaii TaxID=2968086 RepID=A0ABY5KHJ1_9ACTN|nr:bile acid:sodium symporter family protein [Aeromicrobium duanguangcaii]MCD9153653.1 bile acid:sodium symporter family protein [Aeromicrobium duanguangcaii]MCL3836362.1 bile acid:sodium symporter family protein [Aeromicrobium duanguangcaii]UUI69264.1 bile acid:sodium symporter family protein [Aeromicrobium duanguangcaii]
MDSTLSTVGLPAALGIIMFGLGLSLTVGDFARVRQSPRAVVIALACQLVLLPIVCFGLVLALDLPPLLAVGMLLLAASPGGSTANLFSHLFRGDVALNITLTAINSIVAIVSLPIVTNLAMAYYDLGDEVSLQYRKVVEVFAVVLVPVALGMLVRAKGPDFAHRMDKPVRIGSAVLLLIIIVGIVADQRSNVGDYAASVGLAVAIFCAASLVIGYLVPWWAGVKESQAVACSFEIGVHNATLAIYVAVEVLDNVELSVPAAVYGLVMFLLATLWGLALTRWILPRRTETSALPSQHA